MIIPDPSGSPVQSSPPHAVRHDHLAPYLAKIHQNVRVHLKAQRQYPFLGDIAAAHAGSQTPSPDAALCLAMVEACAGVPDDGLGAAAALDLAHRALAMHHQVIFEAQHLETERQPSSDIPLRLNVGDGLMVLCLRPLVAPPRRLGPQQTLELTDIIERASMTAIDGCIAMWTAWQDMQNIHERDYFDLLRKTWWPLSQAALEAGLLIGAYDRRQGDAWMSFSFYWCAAWRIADDIRQLTDPKQDLPNRLSLPLAFLFERLDAAECRRLQSLLLRRPEGAMAVDRAWMHQRLDHWGCLEATQRTSLGMIGAALQTLRTVSPSLPQSSNPYLLERLTQSLVLR